MCFSDQIFRAFRSWGGCWEEWSGVGGGNARFLTRTTIVKTVCIILALLFTPLDCNRVRVHFSRTLAVLPFFAPTTVPKLFIKYVVTGLFNNTVPMSVVFKDVTALVKTMFACELHDYGHFLTPVPPVISGTIVIPFMLRFKCKMGLPVPLVVLAMNVKRMISYNMMKLVLRATLLGCGGIVFESREAMWLAVCGGGSVVTGEIYGVVMVHALFLLLFAPFAMASFLFASSRGAPPSADNRLVAPVYLCLLFGFLRGPLFRPKRLSLKGSRLYHGLHLHRVLGVSRASRLAFSYVRFFRSFVRGGPIRYYVLSVFFFLRPIRGQGVVSVSLVSGFIREFRFDS